MPLRPFYAQIAGLTHHCSCGSSPVSTFVPRESASSKLLSARDSIFLSKLLLPNTERPWWRALPLSTSRPCASTNKDSEVALFLPAAAAICLLISTSQWEPSQPHGLPQVLAGIMPARSNFLITTFMKLFLTALFFLIIENVTLHVFLLTFSFAPNLLTLVLQAFPHYLPELPLLLC